MATTAGYAPAEFSQRPDAMALAVMAHVHVEGVCIKDRRGDCPTRLNQAEAARTAPAASFIRPCLDCGSTVRVIDTVEQAHDCQPHAEPTEQTRALVAHAYWAGYDTGRGRR